MLLRASRIVVRHHPAVPPTLDGIDLEVAQGEVIAVVGSNGSGKSTLARALAGLIALESGHVEGPAPGSVPRVGLVLQDPAAQLLAVTVADEIAIGPEARGFQAPEVARIVDAIVRGHRLDELWARDPATLSGGEQQRVAVAAIEACSVDVLVLDEPTALLDPVARSRFVSSVREHAAGRGVVWITQDPDDVTQCDRVVVLDAGVVAWAGSIEAWVASPDVAATFGLQLPAAARVAHALAARGAWPVGAGIPLHEWRFVDVLAGVVSNG